MMPKKRAFFCTFCPQECQGHGWTFQFSFDKIKGRKFYLCGKERDWYEKISFS